MNTIEDLLDNNMELHTAETMLNEYRKRIGTMNGIYEITDITYDFNKRGKDVTLKCTECGKVIHRTMISGRNKWSELIKSCECQKEREIARQKEEFLKSQKIKKDLAMKDATSMLGNEYGDYKITGLTQDMRFELECKECGNLIYAPYQSIKDNAKKYSHCTKHYVQPIKFDENYIGKKNNYLTVIGLTRLPNKHRAFICECDCGNTVTIEPVFWDKGYIKSCGCKQRELLREANTKHGYSGDRLYAIWTGMKQRCCNEKNPNYDNWGGRGITVCQEWLDDFLNFREWAIQSGYDYNAERGECTIDRIDVNGNYEPNNCRWADMKVQRNNQRPRDYGYRKTMRNVNGEEKSTSEWYTIYGVTAPTVAYRMNTYGLSFEEALTMPRMTIGRPRKEVKNAQIFK